MKKKLLLAIAMVALLVSIFAISASAARVENYSDTFTLRSVGQISHWEKWLYNDGKSAVRKACVDDITISFFDEKGNPLTEVAMWEYDEEEGRYYSLVWYISDYELFWEDQTYTDENVGTQTYPKYTSAKYTLKSVRALDLRYVTYNEKRSNNVIESWKDGKTLKALKGIYLDVNNTPDNTKDDLKLQDAVGIGRDNDNYGYFGYDAQFAATGNKIVVGNFRDCDFQSDKDGNYNTSDTWSRANNLQCLWYPDTMLYMYTTVGPVYEVDVGDGLEILGCQILRDNKRVKEFRIPNSVLYLSNEAFRGSDLTTLIVGEGLMAHGGQPFMYTGGADYLYLSKNILSASFTSSIPNLVANKSVTIYFDGGLEEAEALKEKIGYDGKITLVDYNEQSTRGDLKNAVVFYNYNRCDAFYSSSHDVTLGYKLNSYFADIKYCGNCTRCAKAFADDSKTIAALFTWKGYSHSEFADVNNAFAVTQTFKVNKKSIEAYKAITGTDFSFGVIATGNAASNKENNLTVAPVIGDTKVLSHDLTKLIHDYFDIKISGILEANFDTRIVFCAYVIDGERVSYLDGGETKSALTGLSFNELVKIKKAENAQ